MKKIAFPIVIKLAILMLIAAVAPTFVSYRGVFSFPDVLLRYHLPLFLRSFANFDGIHYVKIASEGYYGGGFAFFPLYPLLIHIFSYFFLKNHLIAAILISNVAFFIGCFYANELLKLLKISRWWFFTFLLTFPTSFFFHVAYSESLFFMLVMMSLFYLKKNQPEMASLSVILASLTRLIGGFLVIPFFWYFLSQHKSSSRRWLNLFVALTPLVGVVIYACYQWWAAGDPLAFVHAQPSFGAGRSLGFISLPQVYFRYLKIIFTAQHNFEYFIAIVELTLFTFVIITTLFDTIKRYKLKDNFLFSIGVFSLASMIFPTITGTLLSTPRFALLSLSTFIFLADIKNSALKITLVILFGVLQAVLFMYFIQGYFVS